MQFSPFLSLSKNPIPLNLHKSFSILESERGGARMLSINKENERFYLFLQKKSSIEEGEKGLFRTFLLGDSDLSLLAAGDGCPPNRSSFLSLLSSS